jgi:hypothetical protein
MYMRQQGYCQYGFSHAEVSASGRAANWFEIGSERAAWSALPVVGPPSTCGVWRGWDPSAERDKTAVSMCIDLRSESVCVLGATLPTSAMENGLMTGLTHG